MLSSLGKGFMWCSSKFAVPFTLGGAILLPFFGAVANRTKQLNPDADLGDLLGGWFSPLITDPKNALVIDPDLAVDPDTLLTGFDGVLAGLGSSIDGWGHILGATWDIAAPIAADIGLTGGAGSLASAFSMAASGTAAACEINPFDLACG